MEIQKQNGTRELAGLSKKGSKSKAFELVLNKESVLTQYGASLTIELTMSCPSMRSIVISNGEAPVIVFITAVLNEFLSFVPNALNSDEIVLYADAIMAHRPTWSSDDLVLCLTNGKNGKYGVVKYNWKWNVFVEWAEKYDREKEDFFYNKHLSTKNAEHVDILKHIPKNIIEKFNKATPVDPNKPDYSNIQIPNEIINQGVKAVDEWIDKYIKKK